MSDTVAHLIRERAEHMTKSERRVARSLLANYPLLGLRTVADLATEAGVSAPTVLRFVARLDFDGYADFQARLHDELADQLKAPLEKVTPAGANGELAAAMTANLAGTLDGLVEADVAGTVALLASRRRPVYLTGGRFTDPLAAYLAAHLRLMRPGVRHIEPVADRRRDCLLDMTKSTILVVFDIRRYDRDLVDFARSAVERGAKVILFTDQWLSPVSHQSSHVLAAHVEVPSIWDSNAALMATVEIVLARGARATWSETTNRLRTLETLREDRPTP
jgi:DNA-binding MurR/RpiR family transcriptional regulator